MPTGILQGSDHAAVLRAEYERVQKADPFRTLAVEPLSDSNAVRHAYLSMTKRFHPNRFALEAPATRELANELFLLIRKAYDILNDPEKRRVWRERLGVTSATPAATTSPAVAAPAARPATPRPGSSTNPGPGAATGTGAPQAPRTGPPAGRAFSSTLPAGSAGPGAAGGAARGSPTTPPRSSSNAPTTPTTPDDSQAPARAMSSRPTTPAASSDAVQAMLEQARTRPQRFDQAQVMVRRGQYREARELLQKIAMEDPQSRKYRAAMHIAWGFEHLESGNAPESRAEFERALGLEPDSDDAKKGLAKAKDADKKPGILSKLFGR